jgi:hypothetical protein
VGVDCATDTVVSIIAPPLSGYEFWRPSWDSVHNKWGAPDHMDTRIVECSMKPEVRFGYREEAAADLLT